MIALTVAAIASLTGPVAAAVTEIVRVLVIALAVIAGSAVLGVAGLVAWRLHQDHRRTPRALTVTARPLHRPSGALQANQPPANQPAC